MEPEYKANKKSDKSADSKDPSVIDSINMVTDLRNKLSSDYLTDLSKSQGELDIGPLIDLICAKLKYDEITIPANERLLAIKTLESVMDYMVLRGTEKEKSLDVAKYLLQCSSKLAANLTTNI